MKESLPKKEPQKEVQEADTTLSRREMVKALGKGAMIGAGIVGGIEAGGILEVVSNKKKEIRGEKAEEKENIETTYKEWREFRKLILAEGLYRNDRINGLKERLGKQADSLFYQVTFQLTLIQELMRREHEGEDLRHTEQGRSLLSQATTYYKRFWSVKHIDARLQEQEMKGRRFSYIEGFDSFPRMTNSELRRTLENDFSHLHPRWLYKNVSTYRYIDEEVIVKGHGRIAGAAITKGLESTLYKSEEQEVQIFKGIGKEELPEILAHEIGHHNDWENTQRLPINERITFLEDVMYQFFDSTRRYSTPYIESFVGEDSQTYRMLKEYWAEIAIEFSLRREQFKKDYPKDYALVKKWYDRITRDYETGK